MTEQKNELMKKITKLEQDIILASHRDRVYMVELELELTKSNEELLDIMTKEAELERFEQFISEVG